MKRERVALSPAVLVAVVLIAICAVDLARTVTASGSRSSTSLLRLPPLLQVLVLAALGLLGCGSVIRSQARHRLAAEQLARAQADADRLLKVVDNTSAVIYMRDQDGRYLLVNRQYEQLFGIKRKEIVGLTDHDLFPKELADDFRANDLKALARGAPIQMEEVAPHADGPHTYITVKYPITDQAGRLYAICGISTDITPLKRVEEKERRLNAELEGRVRDRTAELEASTRELDAFAYSVSHDLRAPLRAVAGFSEVLLEDYSDQLDEGGQGYLRRVVAGTERMGQLIDDLLNLSRATRAELSRRPVDMTALSQRVLAELSDADPDRRPGMRATVEDGLVAIGDPTLLELVLRNLISNAWKFTAKRPAPHLHVGSAGDADGSRVFFVRDNGAGFDMRYVDKLFAPFQRLHTFEEFAGSGIGLAIVSRIVARHGGQVWAEGEPDQGAVFYFSLPGGLG